MNRRVSDPIELPFNPDTMSVQDMKAAVKCLRGIFQDFDQFHEEMDDPEEFCIRVMQVRDRYTVE